MTDEQKQAVWTTEYRWETGKPDDFFVRVYLFQHRTEGGWCFQFYDWDGEFLEDAEGGGYDTPEAAQKGAEEWYQQYVAGEVVL